MPTIKPVSITDNTPEGARAFLQDIQRRTRDVFRARGELLPIAFMVGDRDPTTCAMLDEAALTMMPIDPDCMQSNDTKNSLVTTMNELAVSAGAFGIVFVCEMWMKWFDKDHGESLDSFRASGRSLNDEANADGRQEGVILAFEHRALPGVSVKEPMRLQSTICWAQIIRPGRGKPRLAPWETNIHAFEGRFTGLLPDDEYLNKAAECLDQMRAVAKHLQMTQAHAAEVTARGRLHQPGFPPPKWLAQRLREMEW